MTTPKRCPNEDAGHSKWLDMTRLYVRQTIDGKRKWVAIGHYCDPDKKDYWRGSGCGYIKLDSGAILKPIAPAPDPEDQ